MKRPMMLSLVNSKTKQASRSKQHPRRFLQTPVLQPRPDIAFEARPEDTIT